MKKQEKQYLIYGGLALLGVGGYLYYQNITKDIYSELGNDLLKSTNKDTNILTTDSLISSLVSAKIKNVCDQNIIYLAVVRARGEMEYMLNNAIKNRNEINAKNYFKFLFNIIGEKCQKLKL